MRLSTILLVLLVLLSGCQEGPTSPRLQVAVAGLFAEGNQLEVGEVLALRGGSTQAIFVTGGEQGSEYLLVPFNASKVSTDNLAIEVTGGNVRSPSSLRSSTLPPGRSPEATLASDMPPRDQAFHLRLRQREIRELTRFIPAARAWRTVGASESRSRAPLAPAVGDTLTLNASTVACETPNFRTARVAAVTDRAIVAEDIANPPGGFTAEEFRFVGETFDTLIYPVDTRNFGEPTDIDDNNRVIIFYTRAVNELTPPNSQSLVGGFFFGRDLFPRQPVSGFPGCPGSNAAEIFYLLAPDPTGAINGNVRSKELVLRSTLGTVAHEFQHLINASRRIYINDAGEFEEVWLNEGLSHIAEELMFYAATPLEPRQNIDLETLRSSEQIRRAINTYGISNFGRYSTYLENPDEESLLGIDNLPTRGASWAFLRYTADQEPGPDREFFFRLVNSPVSGVENLSRVLGADAIDFMQAWTVSVFTDDFVPRVPVRFQQPSWNFRSIIPVFSDGVFPLETIPLSGSEARLSLKGGGAAFVRFGIAPGQRASLTVLSGGAVPPERLRISLVRIR